MINLDSGRDDRIQPASLSLRRTVVTPADHASGYSIPRRCPRVIHGRFLFDNAGKGTRVAPPRVPVSSRFSNFVRAGTASRVAQAASELSVASCQRGHNNSVKIMSSEVYYRSWMDKPHLDPNTNLLTEEYVQGIGEFMRLVQQQPDAKSDRKQDATTLGLQEYLYVFGKPNGFH
ncbi:hypothetical protein DY000_02039427 [Brassica cretica]|uniref:Uncharacterized protein n=1 Tax=Brassica cretica TaxID=69181 RepID=A0ABQ7BKR0_BRACR|nr:hypothetical protein DY000_02039427 [Brassica cretica]